MTVVNGVTINGFTPSPKEDREISMNILERESRRIRMEQNKKVVKSTREQMVAKSNARPLVVTRSTKSLGRAETKGRLHMRDVSAMGDERFEWRGPTGGASGDTRIQSTQVFAVSAQSKQHGVSPERRFLRLGCWGW